MMASRNTASSRSAGHGFMNKAFNAEVTDDQAVNVRQQPVHDMTSGR